MIHMKCQALVSLSNKKINFRMSPATLSATKLLSILRVKDTSDCLDLCYTSITYFLNCVNY